MFILKAVRQYSKLERLFSGPKEALAYSKELSLDGWTVSIEKFVK